MYQGESIKTERLIYTRSSLAQQSLFHLQEIGELQVLKPHTIKRENLASLPFFYIVTGERYFDLCGHLLFLICR